MMEGDDEPTCETCATIVDIFSAEFDEWDDEILGEVSAVLDGGCPHTTSIRRAANLDQPVWEYPSRLLAIKKESNQTATRFGLADVTPEGAVVFDNVSTTPMELVSRKDQQNHPGRAILPDPKWIDLNTVLGWVSRCESEHQGKCDEPRWFKGVEPVDPEWLVDVVQGCVVPSPSEGTKYTALSYTWGQCRYRKNTEDMLNQLQQPGILNSGEFATQLPPTIRNAMEVCKRLGQRYIWIDALCIIQDDAESLTRNLNQMQLIYANSTFCIMGATGSGADFGLRGLQGISHERDLELRVYDLADGDKLAAGSLSLDPSSGTKHSYYQRSWTFQEWLFSRRRIVFNHGPLMWQCQSARWYEHLEINPLADKKWASQAQEKFGPAPSIWSFMPTVTDFNRKSLTMSEDAPKAFAGIQAMLHRVHPGGLLFGLSEFFFEICLTWSCLWSDIERRGAFDATNGLPSWSWIGWQGDISFPYDAEFRFVQPWHHQEQKVGFREPVTEWFTMTSPNAKDKRKVRSEWHKYKTLSEAGASPEKLDGWNQQPFDPKHHVKSFRTPGRESEYVYTHRLDRIQEFRYPVPVLQWAATPKLSEQIQFLSCETSRVRLTITQDSLISGVEDYDRRVQIKDMNVIVVSLTMPSSKLTQEFMTQSRGHNLELIAVAKGWSTWLGEDVIHEVTNSDEQHDEQSYLRAPGMVVRDCYFVLLIETVNGVSYRRANGEALESWWDEKKDLQPAQMVLG